MEDSLSENKANVPLSESPEEQVVALCQENEGLIKRVEEAEAQVLRVLAESENLRKRLLREKETFVKYGHEGLLRDLLPVLDSLDQAIGKAKSEEEGEAQRFVEGFELIRKQLLDKLERFGLKPIETSGSRFDPNLHQALQRLESAEVEAETVAEEYMRGYTLHERLLRPAMVNVLVPRVSINE